MPGNVKSTTFNSDKYEITYLHVCNLQYFLLNNILNIALYSLPFVKEPITSQHSCHVTVCHIMSCHITVTAAMSQRPPYDIIMGI